MCTNRWKIDRLCVAGKKIRKNGDRKSDIKDKDKNGNKKCKGVGILKERKKDRVSLS